MSEKKRSLEEAIKVSKLQIENDKNKIIIDRTRKASRKYGRLSDITVSRGPLDDITNVINSNEDDLFWKEKHDKLFAEYKTQQDNLNAALKRNESLENYVKLLEQKSESNQTEYLKIFNDNVTAKSLQEKVKFYESITGLTIKANETQEYTCTMKNGMSRLVTRFAARIRPQDEEVPADSDPDNDLQFRPVGNVHLLPEYLRGEIECSSEMGPVLLGDIIRNVFEEQQQR